MKQDNILQIRTTPREEIRQRKRDFCWHIFLQFYIFTCIYTIPFFINNRGCKRGIFFIFNCMPILYCQTWRLPTRRSKHVKVCKFVLYWTEQLRLFKSLAEAWSWPTRTHLFLLIVTSEKREPTDVGLSSPDPKRLGLCSLFCVDGQAHITQHWESERHLFWQWKLLKLIAANQDHSVLWGPECLHSSSSSVCTSFYT
jgi:hypothetical protein